MNLDLERLVDVYRAESAENVATMEQALLSIERSGDADADLVHDVLRAAHTLKGNSATMGFTDVADAAHSMEDALQRVRDGELRFTADLAEQLLESLDRVCTMLHVHAGGAASGGAMAAETAAAPARVTSLRVNLSRLDTLLDLTAEITIARGQLCQLLGTTAAADAALGATLWQLEQLHGALHEEVMSLRMVPLGGSFRAHERTARDVARHGNKDVTFTIEGEDVEVDTSIADQLRDPLTHMIRNAVDHGIEGAVERQSRGKAATGRVTLRAMHRAGAVIVELTDDGRGLDRAKIAARAEAMGLVSDASSLSDEQLFAFIFEPGFSTAAEVSAVSGRGVGMDVVRRGIHALRGTIDISSTSGAGTTFTIRLPLTVAIIGGLLVGADDTSYVLPIDAVEECIDFASSRAQGARSGILNVRGAPVPYAHLGDALGRRANGGGRDVRACVVVLRHGHRRIGLVVDTLHGDCQAVVKPLAGALQQLPGISGSTILGSGRVALILDVPQLAEIISTTLHTTSPSATGGSRCCVQ